MTKSFLAACQPLKQLLSFGFRTDSVVSDQQSRIAVGIGHKQVPYDFYGRIVGTRGTEDNLNVLAFEFECTFQRFMNVLLTVGNRPYDRNWWQRSRKCDSFIAN